MDKLWAPLTRDKNWSEGLIIIRTGNTEVMVEVGETGYSGSTLHVSLFVGHEEDCIFIYESLTPQ